jgi:3-oxoacyl-[acyl-carrier protein] reductase
MSKLQGKTAIVTGASKGIGAGIAKELAASGAAVVVNYATDRNGAEAVVTTITSAGGRAVAIPGDVSKASVKKSILRAPPAKTCCMCSDVLAEHAG